MIHWHEWFDIWTLVLTVVTSVICYVWICLRDNQFRTCAVPYNTPWPIVGNMGPVAFKTKHLHELVKQTYDQFPDAKYVGFYNFSKPGIMIRDPEMIKSLGVKNFDLFRNHMVFVDEKADPIFGKSLFLLKDEKWRKVRHLLSPAFTTSKMRMMFELITQVASKFSHCVTDEVKNNGTEFEMKELFARYTNDVIATCAFGIEVDSMKNKDNDFYRTARIVTSLSGWKVAKLALISLFPKLAKLLRITVFDNKMTFFKNVIRTTIEMRLAEGIVRPDMLQLMIESRSKSETIEMNVDDMIGHAFVFFFGGFETSSSLMSYVATALALHSQVQNNLLQEIRQVEKHHPKLTYEIINNMPYLEAVIFESLRLYSVSGLVDRVSNTPFQLPPAVEGAKPFTITPGMFIWFPTVGLHLDPQYYPQPNQFQPERFLDKKSYYSSTFLPFGVGPRACIGSRFAILQTKIVIFNLLSRVQLKPSDSLKLPLQLDTSTYNAVADGGFRLQLLPRQSGF